MLVALLVLLIFFKDFLEGFRGAFLLYFKGTSEERKGRGERTCSKGPANFFLIINIHSLMIISLCCTYLFNVEHFGAPHTNESELLKVEQVINSTSSF